MMNTNSPSDPKILVATIAMATHLSSYMVGVAIAVIYLLQAIVTRKGQMLPIKQYHIYANKYHQS